MQLASEQLGDQLTNSGKHCKHTNSNLHLEFAYWNSMYENSRVNVCLFRKLTTESFQPIIPLTEESVGHQPTDRNIHIPTDRKFCSCQSTCNGICRWRNMKLLITHFTYHHWRPLVKHDNELDELSLCLINALLPVLLAPVKYWKLTVICLWMK
jgi:hypothetical protein